MVTISKELRMSCGQAWYTQAVSQLQKFTRTANWNARGPPVPKTPPAVWIADPNLDERKKPASNGLVLSGSKVFWNPEKFTLFRPRMFVTLNKLNTGIECVNEGIQLGLGAECPASCIALKHRNAYATKIGRQLNIKRHV